MSGRGSFRGGGRGSGARGGRGRGRSDGGRSGRGDRGGGRGRGGSGRGGPKGPTTVNEVITNLVEAGIMESFDYYLIGLDAQNKHGEQIDSAARRSSLFYMGLRKTLESLPKANQDFYMRTTFAQGSCAYAGRRIPGLENHMVLLDGSTTQGDSLKIVEIERFTAPACFNLSSTSAGSGQVKIDQLRCQGSARTFSSSEKLLQHCKDTGESPIVINEDEPSKVAEPEQFLAYVNSALQRAMGEQLVRWGQDYFDPNDFKEDWGLKIFRAISLSFSIAKIAKIPKLFLTCDLKSKVMRLNSLLDDVNENRSKQVSSNTISRANRKWVNEDIIYRSDRKRYAVVKLHFDKSPDSFKIPDTNKSHTEYFASKGIELEFPSCPPMVEVKGRRDHSIYLPPELVFQYELDPKSRMKLPQIASYDPPTRHDAINKALLFLTPGKSKSTGGTLLPALGIVLEDFRLKLKAKTLPFPSLVAPGIERHGNNFSLATANYKVEPSRATVMNVVLFYNEYIQGYDTTYKEIKNRVNGMNSRYRFPNQPVATIETNTIEQHFGAVERFFSSDVPPNVFVLDFTRPKAASDQAYPVIKKTLGQFGYLSQFVNWKTCAHDEDLGERKSNSILEGVSRQILQKAGVLLWYASLPREIPLPAMFLGIDVFHAPIVYDLKTKKRCRKSSVVAFVFNIIEKAEQGRPIVARTYTRTYRRDPGVEFNLKEPLKESVREAVVEMKMLPKSVFVYRDGMNTTSVSHELDEIDGVRQGLKITPVGGGPAPVVPIAYINCQKRIANKFLTMDGQFAAPPGTMITGIQGMNHKTFYINNSAPKGSTGKPTRFELVKRDAALKDVKIEELTFALCHVYPNWTGQIKVPGPVQCAHKAAELAGSMSDAGESINAKAYTNTSYYL